MVYEDQKLRQQALNTIAVETPRGFRIAKEKGSKKIDAIVALSMACVAALDVPKNVKLEDLFMSASFDDDSLERRTEHGEEANYQRYPMPR